MIDLQRFVDAQRDVYDRALLEIKAGAKQSHWMWFIFPQLAGLGTSTMAQRYAISGLEEARHYIEHQMLGQRYRQCVCALQELSVADPIAVFGVTDAMKLRSSLTLFGRAAPSALFARALERWGGDQEDTVTVALLCGAAPSGG